MLLCGTPPGELLGVCHGEEKALQILAMSSLTHPATLAFRSHSGFTSLLPQPVPTLTVPTLPALSVPRPQPLFHFAAHELKAQGLGSYPSFLHPVHDSKQNSFWLKNKLEVSVETSNIFPESTIKTTMLCFNLKWFVQVFVAKPCYSFVYRTKNLRFTSKQNIF